LIGQVRDTARVLGIDKLDVSLQPCRKEIKIDERNISTNEHDIGKKKEKFLEDNGYS
jgi:hypothetical protein